MVSYQRNVNLGSMHSKVTGLVVRYHLQLYDINFGFLFAFRAEEGEVNKNGIFVDFDSCFSVANRAADPKGIAWRMFSHLASKQSTKVVISFLVIDFVYTNRSQSNTVAT